MSSVPQGKRALVINNGVYGDRISQMVGVHRPGRSGTQIRLDDRGQS